MQNMNETNPYLKRLDLLNEARKRFAESEWRLEFLRTIEPAPQPQPTEEELIKWHQNSN